MRYTGLVFVGLGLGLVIGVAARGRGARKKMLPQVPVTPDRLPEALPVDRAALIVAAYPKCSHGLAGIIVNMSDQLGIPDSAWLANLIHFESAGSFSPSRVNDSGAKPSMATGLIQFIPSTAADQLSKADVPGYEPTWYTDKNGKRRKRYTEGQKASAQQRFAAMSAEEQMGWVYRYLAPNRAHYQTQQGLFMSVFYPDAMDWPPDREFNSQIQAANPGIRNPGDYMAMVRRHAKMPMEEASAGFDVSGVKPDRLVSMSSRPASSMPTLVMPAVSSRPVQAPATNSRSRVSAERPSGAFSEPRVTLGQPGQQGLELHVRARPVPVPVHPVPSPTKRTVASPEPLDRRFFPSGVFDPTQYPKGSVSDPAGAYVAYVTALDPEGRVYDARAMRTVYESPDRELADAAEFELVKLVSEARRRKKQG